MSDIFEDFFDDEKEQEQAAKRVLLIDARAAFHQHMDDTRAVSFLGKLEFIRKDNTDNISGAIRREKPDVIAIEASLLDEYTDWNDFGVDVRAYAYKGKSLEKARKAGVKVYGVFNSARTQDLCLAILNDKCQLLEDKASEEDQKGKDMDKEMNTAAAGTQEITLDVDRPQAQAEPSGRDSYAGRQDPEDRDRGDRYEKGQDPYDDRYGQGRDDRDPYDDEAHRDGYADDYDDGRQGRGYQDYGRDDRQGRNVDDRDRGRYQDRDGMTAMTKAVRAGAPMTGTAAVTRTATAMTGMTAMTKAVRAGMLMTGTAAVTRTATAMAGMTAMTRAARAGMPMTGTAAVTRTATAMAGTAAMTRAARAGVTEDLIMMIMTRAARAGAPMTGTVAATRAVTAIAGMTAMTKAARAGMLMTGTAGVTRTVTVMAGMTVRAGILMTGAAAVTMTAARAARMIMMTGAAAGTRPAGTAAGTGTMMTSMTRITAATAMSSFLLR